MTAAISFHLDSLVWDLHVWQLVKDNNVTCEWGVQVFWIFLVIALPIMIHTSIASYLTSPLRPIKGILVSHIATTWASSLLKAHISPDRFGFFGSGSPCSPDIYRMVTKYSHFSLLLHILKVTHIVALQSPLIVGNSTPQTDDFPTHQLSLY